MLQPRSLHSTRTVHRSFPTQTHIHTCIHQSPTLRPRSLHSAFRSATFILDKSTPANDATGRGGNVEEDGPVCLCLCVGVSGGGG